MVTTQDRAPSLRWTMAGAGLVWLAAAAGVVLAFRNDQPLAAVWALVSCITSAGWVLATDRWLAWRALCEATLETLEHHLRGD